MTTAHRPTWKAAVGRANEGGWTAGGASSTQQSALDAPSQLSLKVRAQPVDRKKALQESLLALEQAEQETANSNKKRAFGRPNDPQLDYQKGNRLSIANDDDRNIKTRETSKNQERLLLKQKSSKEEDEIGGSNDDDDKEPDGRSRARKKGDGESSEEESDLDADDDDEDKSDDDDDDDDEEELQAELAKIRAEREETRRKEAAQEQAQDEESALLGNPLLSAGGTAAAAATNKRHRRRWNDDVVFRNQAKGEPQPKKRFINDTVRNDFHKRFLNKFIR
ncbi:hypothetical protein ACA910_020957 [Epithemia clementina (nom. ined.)]